MNNRAECLFPCNDKAYGCFGSASPMSIHASLRKPGAENAVTIHITDLPLTLRELIHDQANRDSDFDREYKNTVCADPDCIEPLNCKNDQHDKADVVIDYGVCDSCGSDNPGNPEGEHDDY